MAVRTRRGRCVQDHAPCPVCERPARKHMIVLHHLNDLGKGGPAFLDLQVSYHHCRDCAKFFMNPQVAKYAEPGSRFTKRVSDKAVRLVQEEGLSVDLAREKLRREFDVTVSRATLYRWCGQSEPKRTEDNPSTGGRSLADATTDQEGVPSEAC